VVGTDGSDVLGRRVLLEGVFMTVFLLCHLEFFAASCGQLRLRLIGSCDFGFGEPRVKTLHRPRSLLMMVALLIVAPLLGGIVVEPFVGFWPF
jgi:hypothetical protein